MTEKLVKCSTCGNPDMMLCDCSLPSRYTRAADALAPISDDVVERVARAIHEARSSIPWEVTSQQDLAYRDARAALNAIGGKHE